MSYDNLADPNSINPETDVIQEEVFDKIKKEAFKCLTAQQETALTLTAINDMTATEAGEIMGLTANTVKSHARQAKARLLFLLSGDAIKQLPSHQAHVLRLHLIEGQSYEKIAKKFGYIGADGKPDINDKNRVKSIIKKAKSHLYKVLRADGYYALLEKQ